MNGDSGETGHLRGFRRRWPWLVMALLLIPAVWHFVDFDEDIDPEFPGVARPAFSRMPPAAYRLAEPGDTLDRIMLYFSAAGVVLASTGLVLERGGSLWLAAVAVGLTALWYSATPGPTVDGWYGLGWRTIADPDAPPVIRLVLVGGAIALSSLVGWTLVRRRARLIAYWVHSKANGTRWLWITGCVLVLARQFDIPGVEPQGYWPRWCMIGGLVAFVLVMLIELVPVSRSFRGRWLILPMGSACWLALVVLGISLTWYHRPLARLKEVVPGKIYLSAMPTPLGLELAQQRHHFRTIINLFPEHTSQRSPLLPDELRFVRDHDIRYVSSPPDPSEASSSAFLDQTLALARDPSAWPILVHCHGCMDRSPAWMGIYRFVVQDRPLIEIMQEIERHRGCRPKASVTLLYNRVLPPRAGARYWADPTAALLRQCALGVTDPMIGTRGGNSGDVNLEQAKNVPGEADKTARRTR
jgi:predicted protein tyrosine phosphatase